MLEDTIREGKPFLAINIFVNAIKSSVMDLPIGIINEFKNCVFDDTRNREKFYEEYNAAMSYVLPIMDDRDAYRSLLLTTMGPALELQEIFIHKGETGLKDSESYNWFVNNLIILLEQYPELFPVDPAVLDNI